MDETEGLGMQKVTYATEILCTVTSLCSHELQTCDWPRNVGCGAEGESATVSTVRVTDPRTKQTSPTGLPSRQAFVLILCSCGTGCTVSLSTFLFS